MGSIEDFMSRVVPWPEEGAAGLINLHYTSPKGEGMRGKPFNKVADLLSYAQWGATKPGIVKDIYFCLSSQKATGKIINGKATAYRNARNVHRLKSLWMDIDVKPEKGYATVTDAVNALTAFVSAAALPPPSALVLSGSGVHVYWISDTPLTVEEWRPYAEGLEALAKQHGLKRDPGLTTDSVRVLRVPGTFNYKTAPPTGVRLAALCPTDVSFRDTLTHIRLVPSAVTASVTKPVGLLYDPAKFPLRAIDLTAVTSLAAGIHVNDDTPLDYAEVVKNCGHFRQQATTHGAGTEQGLWMLDMLACTFMQDDRKLAHFFSRGYKTYTPEETDAMFDRKKTERAERGLGWPSCEAFENAGCKECATCPFRGKIRSPLNLAARAAPIHPVAVAPPPPPDLCLPDGYTVDTETGCIGMIVHKMLPGGGTSDEFAQLFRCKITNPYAETGSLRFTVSVDLDNTKPVAVKEGDIATEQSLLKTLWHQSVKVYMEHKQFVGAFMSAWLEKLDQEKKRLATIPFGWVMENGGYAGFAYNGKVYRKDGVDHPAGTPDAQLQLTYTPQGKPEPWHQALKVITDRHHPALEALVAMAFGAPLLTFAGQYAGVLVGSSNGSGAHKSTALRTGLAVWGNPKFSKDVPNASDNFLEGKLATLKNLPLVWDELSDPKKLERVVRLVGGITEGVAGGKMYQDRSNRPTGDWQSLITIGANTSVWDAAIKLTKATDAQLRRLFEMKVAKVPGSLRISDVSTLIQSLDHNFGWAGVRYAEFLGRHSDEVERDTKEILNKLEDELKVLDEERFWCAVVATLVAGAEFANRVCGATFNVGELYVFLKETFLELRANIAKHAVVGGSSVNVGALLTQFFKAFPDNHLWIDKKPRGRGKQAIHVIHQNDVLHPKAVHIQWVRDDRLLRLSQSKFEEFIDTTPYGRQAVMDGLDEHYNARGGLHRVDLAAWTPQAGGPETIIEIPIPPGHDLEDYLFQYTPANEFPADYKGAPSAL